MYWSILMSRPLTSEVKTPFYSASVLGCKSQKSLRSRCRLTALLSVARLSFLICSAASTRSSVLPLALRLVKGVLPPLIEVLGVVFPLADFLAAFSARRFCFEAEGAMVYYRWVSGEELR